MVSSSIHVLQGTISLPTSDKCTGYAQSRCTGNGFRLRKIEQKPVSHAYLSQPASQPATQRSSHGDISGHSQNGKSTAT